MSNFEEASRELALQEARIVRQEALIERLTQVGSPVEKAIDRLLQMQLLALDMRGQMSRMRKDRTRVAA